MSMLYLGEMYRKGDGTKKDLVQAESWFQRAADKGSNLAKYHLGKVYLETGRFIEAKGAFEIGVAEGFAPAIYVLGWMYSGHGFRDMRLARDLLEQASSLGHLLAKKSLACLLLSGRFGPLQFLRGIWIALDIIKRSLKIAFTTPSGDIRELTSKITGQPQ